MHILWWAASFLDPSSSSSQVDGKSAKAQNPEQMWICSKQILFEGPRIENLGEQKEVTSWSLVTLPVRFVIPDWSTETSWAVLKAPIEG